MASRKQVQQFINNLYHQDLTVEQMQPELQKLKTMGPEVASVLLEMLVSPNHEEREFALSVVTKLGDKRAIPGLSDIAYSSDQSDEIKLIAATAISLLGGKIDPEALHNSLQDPEGLNQKVQEDLLREAQNPFYVEIFLENFPNIAREGQLLALEDLAQHQGDERVVPIVGPLIDSVDDELREIIVRVLLNSRSHQAFPYLQEIVQKAQSKKVQTEARQAIFLLGTMGVRGELKVTPPEDRFYQAYATTCDGDGSNIYIFSVTTPDNKIRFVDFVNNDSLGIKDSFGGEMSSKDFANLVRKISNEKGFLTVAVGSYFVLDRAKEAERLTQAARRKLPREYLAWKRVFNCIPAEPEFQEKDSAFRELAERLKEKESTLLPRTPELYVYEEIASSWFFDFDEVADEIYELDELEEHTSQVYQRKYNRIYKTVVANQLTEDFLMRLEGRLREYAYLCFLGGYETRAELALVAANTLYAIPKEDHPFLKKMIEHTFNIHLDYVRNKFEDYENENCDAEDRSNQVPPPVFPLDGTLSEWEKLKLLQSKMPQMPFAKTIPHDLQRWSLAERIRTVNLWETAYDNYIETLIGGIDWERLRQELEISISSMPLEGFPAEVEALFLIQMPSRGYDEEHLQLARRLWREYTVIKDYQILPKGKPETWAAGMEYLIGALCYDRDPQQEVAINYGVSTASLAARYKELKETLNLEIFTHEFDKHLSHIADLIRTVIKS